MHLKFKKKLVIVSCHFLAQVFIELKLISDIPARIKPYITGDFLRKIRQRLHVRRGIPDVFSILGCVFRIQHEVDEKMRAFNVLGARRNHYVIEPYVRPFIRYDIVQLIVFPYDSDASPDQTTPIAASSLAKSILTSSPDDCLNVWGKSIQLSFSFKKTVCVSLI